MIEQKNQLYKSILATVVYYDILDYPLTSFEIRKYLISYNIEKKEGDGKKNSLTEVINALESDELQKHIEQYQGFYFLRGRRKLVDERIEKNKLSEEKFKIAKRIARLTRFVPYVRMIAVTGRVAMKNAERKSDIDFLVVLEKGRIFTGRTLVTLLIHLLGRRRHKMKIKNRICLNYFISTDQLEIGQKDLFSSSEYSFIVPLFGRETFSDFQRSNGWIKKYKPQWQEDAICNLKIIKDTRLPRLFRLIGEKIFSIDFVEKRLKIWQTKRIADDPRTHFPGSLVLASDTELIFLPKPQGPGIFQKFKEKLDQIV
jgi:hypothetical protein